MTTRIAPVPPGLQAPGRRLWRAVLTDFELDEHERLLLLEAARTVDVLERLNDEVLAAESLTVTNRRGEPVAHPAAVEARQQRLALARLLASLRMPSGEEETRPQRRGGARGTYRMRAVQ